MIPRSRSLNLRETKEHSTWTSNNNLRSSLPLRSFYPEYSTCTRTTSRHKCELRPSRPSTSYFYSLTKSYSTTSSSRIHSPSSSTQTWGLTNFHLFCHACRWWTNWWKAMRRLTRYLSSGKGSLSTSSNYLLLINSRSLRVSLSRRWRLLTDMNRCWLMPRMYWSVGQTVEMPSSSNSLSKQSKSTWR